MYGQKYVVGGGAANIYYTYGYTAPVGVQCVDRNDSKVGVGAANIPTHMCVHTDLLGVQCMVKIHVGVGSSDSCAFTYIFVYTLTP